MRGQTLHLFSELPVISVTNLTKRYGETVAVDGLSFSVPPGVVTGFLGPNGSGKSTTMRMILGLDKPDHGSIEVDGQKYRDLQWPLREVGALLDAKALHPGRSARSHLRSLAESNGINTKRVGEVLDLVGLNSVAKRKVGKFSLGMGQRLGIAAALLGDPQILLFDEPVNGLDPEGILWVRTLLHGLASEGKTVFVSSHLMSEMALTASNLVVIGRGKLLAETTVENFIASRTTPTVKVAAQDLDALETALRAAGASTTREDKHLLVTEMAQEQVGLIALTSGLALSELTQHSASLEEVFMELTAGEGEYETGATE
jgi:ABC-2 type transport system ATP-binding protein